MKIHQIDEMTRGWFIGNFVPSVLKTELFEVGYLTHKKGEFWPKHFHVVATEINLLVKGRMTVSGRLINPGEIFIFEPGDIADPEFHEDCELVCIKIPSVIGDKYEVL